MKFNPKAKKHEFKIMFGQAYYVEKRFFGIFDRLCPMMDQGNSGRVQAEKCIATFMHNISLIHGKTFENYFVYDTEGRVDTIVYEVAK